VEPGYFDTKALLSVRAPQTEPSGQAMFQLIVALDVTKTARARKRMSWNGKRKRGSSSDEKEMAGYCSKEGTIARLVLPEDDGGRSSRSAIRMTKGQKHVARSVLIDLQKTDCIVGRTYRELRRRFRAFGASRACVRSVSNANLPIEARMW